MEDEKRGRGVQQAVCLSQRERERVCVCVQECSVTPSCLVLCNPMDYITCSSVHGISQQNTRVDCHFLLQGIFPDQSRTQVTYVSCIGRWILYHWAIWEDGYHGGDEKTVTTVVVSTCSQLTILPLLDALGVPYI